MSPEVAIIIPTLNEAGNIAELYKRLQATLQGLSYELIFVDDNSRDTTREEIGKLASADTRVRLIHRMGRRGLSSACIEGMLASFAPFCAVMDADLQHDEMLLPRMLEELRKPDVDMVLGSRFLDTQKLDTQSLSPVRQLMSQWGNRLATYVTKVPLTDPLTGLFMIKREKLMPALVRLTSKGFKIVVDILASSPQPLRVVELPFAFRARHAGQSKLDSMVISEYAFLLAEKLVGRVIPVRFMLFVLVGVLGVGVHMMAMTLAHLWIGLGFEMSQIVALLVAMTANFMGNNWLTYRDRQLRGKRFWLGLISFYLACSLGAVINYGIAERMHAAQLPWLFAAFVGAVIGAVWNYGVTATFTWRPDETGN